MLDWSRMIPAQGIYHFLRLGPVLGVSRTGEGRGTEANARGCQGRSPLELPPRNGKWDTESSSKGNFPSSHSRCQGSLGGSIASKTLAPLSIWQPTATSGYLHLNIESQYKFSSSVKLAHFKSLSSHLWLLATILDSTIESISIIILEYKEHCLQHRKWDQSLSAIWYTRVGSNKMPWHHISML